MLEKFFSLGRHRKKIRGPEVKEPERPLWEIYREVDNLNVPKLVDLVLELPGPVKEPQHRFHSLPRFQYKAKVLARVLPKINDWFAETAGQSAGARYQELEGRIEEISPVPKPSALREAGEYPRRLLHILLEFKRKKTEANQTTSVSEFVQNELDKEPEFEKARDEKQQKLEEGRRRIVEAAKGTSYWVDKKKLDQQAFRELDRFTLLHSPLFTAEELERVKYDLKNLYWFQRHQGSFEKLPIWYELEELLNNPKLSSKVLDAAIDYPDGRIAEALKENPRLSLQQRERLTERERFNSTLT